MHSPLQAIPTARPEICGVRGAYKRPCQCRHVLKTHMLWILQLASQMLRVAVCKHSQGGAYHCNHSIMLRQGLRSARNPLVSICCTDKRPWCWMQLNAISVAIWDHVRCRPWISSWKILNNWSLSRGANYYLWSTTLQLRHGMPRLAHVWCIINAKIRRFQSLRNANVVLPRCKWAVIWTILVNSRSEITKYISFL